MVSFLPFAEKNLGKSGDYVFGLAPLKQELGLVASVSDNSLHLLPFDPLAFKTSSGMSSLKTVKKAHSGTITALKTVSESVVASSGGNEGVRLWDFRTACSAPVMEFKPTNAKQGILALDSLGNFVAAGTELVGVDAGVYIWDIRKAGGAPTVSYVDSHNDDVTDVKFHPQDSNALLSGSTDGLVNVYNTSISDEDEAVYQTINHGASIHSTGFLSKNRLFALSHMETLSVYQVANADVEAEEPKPLEFGDVREAWNCEYVVDMLPGYVGVGNHSGDVPSFRLIPFQNEQANLAGALEFNGAHGEEIVRALYVDDRSAQQCVYSGGEDGIVKVWKASGLDTSSSYFAALPWDVKTEDMDVDSGSEEKARKKEKKEKKEKKDRKEKKDKKDKKEKKDKKDKKEKKENKDHRYKPY